MQCCFSFLMFEATLFEGTFLAKTLRICHLNSASVFLFRQKRTETLGAESHGHDRRLAIALA